MKFQTKQKTKTMLKNNISSQAKKATIFVTVDFQCDGKLSGERHYSQYRQGSIPIP